MSFKSINGQRTDAVKLGVIGILFLILYSPTFQMFIYDWSNDDNYSHGFLVPFIVGYLVWTKRDDLRALVHVGEYGCRPRGDDGARARAHRAHPWRQVSCNRKWKKLGSILGRGS